jgi:hypothetical protein
MSIGTENFRVDKPSPESRTPGGWRNPGFPYLLQCRESDFGQGNTIVSPPHSPKSMGAPEAVRDSWRKRLSRVFS